MEMEFRLHNRGDRGTRLTKIEAIATDAAGKEHSSSQELSVQLNVCDSTKKITCLLSFVPHFQYTIKMPCRFNIVHTHGQYPFTYESQESERYLEQIDASSAYVPK
jgi:hypothetical protein